MGGKYLDQDLETVRLKAAEIKRSERDGEAARQRIGNASHPAWEQQPHHTSHEDRESTAQRRESDAVRATVDSTAGHHETDS